MPDFLRNVGKLWLVVGIGGLLFRTVHLFFIKDVQTGLVWMTKILTDPFHDVMLYWKSPLYLMRGELIDPHHARHGHDDDEWREQHAAPERRGTGMMRSGAPAEETLRRASPAGSRG